MSSDEKEASTSAAPSKKKETCLDEERRLKQEVDVKGVKVTGALPPTIRAQLAAQTERINNEKSRRREVFNAICALVDPVEESVMLAQLNTLDVASWNEVVEERFLGRICGYPVCEESIQIDFRKKFVINKRNNQVYETSHEMNKFCSDRCLKLARAIQSQLHDEPLWLTGARKTREYVIPENVEEYLKECSKPKRSKSAAAAGVPDLVKHIEELYIADNPPSEEDEENDFVREDDPDSEEEQDEREFLDSIRRHVTKT